MTIGHADAGMKTFRAPGSSGPQARAGPRLSIVSKLALLVLAGALPLSAILAWSIDAQFRSEVAAAEQHAVSVANAIATRAELISERTRSLLRSVAARPAVQAMDRDRCDPLLSELRGLTPEYANINTFNLRWEFVCSASFHTPGRVIRSDYPDLYARMKAADDMVMSSPVRGQLTGRLVVIAAYPVKDAADRLIGAVTAPIDVRMLAPVIAAAPLPADALARLINGEGYVVASFPDIERTGKREEGVAAAATAKATRTSIESGPDGVARVYARVRVKGSDWVALAGLPTATAFADFRDHRNRTLAAVLLVLCLAGVLALFMARRISRPIRELQRDAEILANGRLAHRSRVVTNDELGALAGSFNDMARALEANDARRRAAAQELHESERRFNDMLQNVELVSIMLDRAARITYCNEYLLRLTGWRREEIIGRSWFDIFIPPELGVLRSAFADLLADLPESRHRENEILTRAGARRLIRWNNSVLRSGAGEVIGAACIGEDITERKNAEGRIAYLNRVYAMLSGISTLIVRVRDRDELFREACRTAVDAGGFLMSMIAIVDRNTLKIAPVASAGMNEKLMTAIRGLLASGEGAATTMIARAVREKTAVVSNLLHDDPQSKLRELHLESGVSSLAVLPLIVGGEGLGVLVLYAGEIEFFHAEEMKLLKDLAGDIAFAIDHIDKQERLNYLAYYDELTGLANRSLFLERVAQSIRGAASGGHRLAVLWIDLERFKSINDSLGRPAGDALLRQAGEWLARNSGDASLLARVGADHFAAVLPVVNRDGSVARLIEKTIKAFQEHPFRLNDAVFRIAARVGIALYPEDGADAESLLGNAEAALKLAKAGGDRFLFYTQGMTESVTDRLTLENQLRRALDKEEFVLHYQPKVNLASGKLTGAEALIRWNDPETGLVPPGRFIPVLEETGLIHDVGRWAMRRAIEDYLRWRNAGLPAVRIAVNVSPLQLRNAGFIAEIGQAVGVDPHAAEGLELEITESLIMADVRHTIASLKAIRAMGVTIAIDDFGTGFSSLSYLSKLPVDTLKIDGSFVADMTAAPEGLALVSTIIGLAHALKLNVVAEGVETQEQQRLLRLLACDETQGYLISRPVPREVFETSFLLRPPAER